MRSVLILDDEAPFRAALRVHLVAKGWKVLEAGRARDADKLLETETPSLLLVDGLLPDTRGVEWIAARKTAGAQVPTVFVSSFWRDYESYRRLTGDLGVKWIARKPIDDIPAFLAKLDEIVPPTDVASDDPDEALAALRQEFLARLPERVQRVVQAVAAAREAPGSAERREEARQESHKLHGTAGTYGFVAVGTAAGKIEHAIEEVPRDAEAAIATWAKVADAVGELRQALDARGATRPSGTMRAPVDGRLLVIDADPEFLALCRAAQESLGAQVRGAASAEEALQIARADRVDVVLMDMHLPSGKSLDLARALRALPGRERLPMAFVSSDTSLESRAEAARAGATRYLRKPLSAQELANVVDELLTLSRADRPKVLIVDDDADFARGVAAMLRAAEIESLQVGDPSEAFAELERSAPDLVLLDVTMPKMTGYDLCRAIRSDARWDALPIVFVTAHKDRESRLQTFRAGGDDYLEKPVLAEELIARVRVRIDRNRLLRRAVETDSLTGLLLRREFVQRVGPYLEQARRGKAPLSVCLIDLDHFKQVNDKQGHLAGDQVLHEMGRLLRRSFRVYDLRARWGGEELVVALPGESREVAANIGERLLEEVRGLSFTGEGGDFGVTFTAGIATVPEDGDTLDAAIAAADRRLYAGKAAGRNRVVA